MGEKKQNSIKSKLDAFGQFAVDVVYDRREGPWVTVFATVLTGFSYLFTLIAKVRLWLYQNRVFHNNHLGCMVIVVGNITAGGTGKTPVVERLARNLRDRGRKVAILSRGYKSKKEPFYKKYWRYLTHKEAMPPKIVSNGKEVLLDSSLAGDEPYMLAMNLPGVYVLVDKDRVKAGAYAIKHFGVDTIILDDGFQYFKLKDHLQLLMVDKNNPFGNKHLLPRGILREPVSHMKRASYVFITKSDGIPDLELENEIRKHNPDAEIIECTHSPKFLKEIHGEGHEELDWLKDKRVAAFSGIAVPESFEAFLTGFGANICYKKRFLDHHNFDGGEIEAIIEEAEKQNLEMIVTTEKDAARIRQKVDSKVPLYYLRLEVEILNGVKDFEEAVSRICFERKN
jgi:tetraacyldisaccharide 4'-kinase